MLEEVANGKRKGEIQWEDLEAFSPPTGNIRDLWSKLVEYTGLTENEAKIYITLLKLGKATVRQLFVESNVPRQKIYPTLTKLMEFGLVSELPEFPVLYIPHDPGSILNPVYEANKRKNLDFNRVIQSLNNTYMENLDHTGHSVKNVWYLTDPDEIKPLCNTMIKTTEKELVIITNHDGLGLLFTSATHPLDRAIENSVKIKCYTNTDPKLNPLAREMKHTIEITQVVNNPPIFMLIRDSKEVFIGKLAHDGREAKIERAVFFDDPAIVQIVSLLFTE